MITIPTGDLVGILSDVLPFAFPDDDLPAKHAVRIHWDRELLHAITTDGYRAAWSTWAPNEMAEGEQHQDDLFTDWGSGDDEWYCTIALPDAKELARVFKLGPKEYQVPVTVDYEADRRRLTVKRAKDTGHSAITISAEDLFTDEFPNVPQLLDKAGATRSRTTVEYNAKYLADFAKVRARGPLQMRHTKRITLVSIGPRFVGAIVPVGRGLDDDFVEK